MLYVVIVIRGTIYFCATVRQYMYGHTTPHCFVTHLHTMKSYLIIGGGEERGEERGSERGGEGERGRRREEGERGRRREVGRERGREGGGRKEMMCSN